MAFDGQDHDAHIEVTCYVYEAPIASDFSTGSWVFWGWVTVQGALFPKKAREMVMTQVRGLISQVAVDGSVRCG